ncbi:MAG TPA: hypothetical protein VGO69_02610 [Pyrinomonadaceae bacterium]|nr:hypothetical protein [Pyrinomonadaceae bacterium]
MRRILLAGLMAFVLVSFVGAQKRSTFLGDAWIGEVVATNDATRELTLSYTDKGKTETFAGILEEGYKITLKDGSLHELKVSEITPGRRIRVFYKTKQQDVGGRKVEVHRIFRLDLLGKDEYTVLRVSLNLEPSTPVLLAGSDKLPTTNPLKLYLAIEQPHVKDNLVEWVNKWNKEQAGKYGALELVPDLSQADISLVVHWGANETIALLPLEVHAAAGADTLYQATAYVVIKGAEGLKVLWQQRLIIGAEKSVGSVALVEREMEKRMKARLKK